MRKEIEQLLDCSKCKLKECIGCEITWTDRKRIREHIEELGTDKQKLIEKLEEDSKAYARMSKIVDDSFWQQGFYRGHVSARTEILSFLKGEKNEQSI